MRYESNKPIKSKLTFHQSINQSTERFTMKVYAWLIDSIHRRKIGPRGWFSGGSKKWPNTARDNTVTEWKCSMCPSPPLTGNSFNAGRIEPIVCELCGVAPKRPGPFADGLVQQDYFYAPRPVIQSEDFAWKRSFWIVTSVKIWRLTFYLRERRHDHELLKIQNQDVPVDPLKWNRNLNTYDRIGKYFSMNFEI